MNILKLSSKISPTQHLILDSVKAFCQKDLQPSVRENFRQEKTDKNIFKKMGDLGIFGPTLSSHGCLGNTYLTYGLIAKEIEAIDSGYRSIYSVQSSLVMNPISQFGAPEVQDLYLPKLFSGHYAGCFGLTEPNAGSDPSSMTTTAESDQNGNYILNGTKTWISNAPIADVLIVWAKMDGKVNGFVLDRTMDGILTPKIDGKLSLRTSITGSIYLENVKVPKSHRLQVEGLKGPFSCLNSARLGIAFGVLGAAETCIRIVLEYASQRTLFGEPLTKKQLFQLKVANMVSEYNLALLSCIHVADYIDHDNNSKLVPEMISLITPLKI
jgi:glutaryl-CoA dehydrogenase